MKQKHLNLRALTGVGVLATGFLWLAPALTRAEITTNVILGAQASGTIGIQSFDQQFQPVLKTAPFKTKNLLNIVLGGAPSITDKLGVNIDMAHGVTNIYLTVFSTVERGNTVRITTNEVTTSLNDGKTFVFTTEAPVAPTSLQSGGGLLRIAGTAKMVNGVPANLKASMEGLLIDNRPGDLHGTTGLVLRAKISTTGKPLRVQPPVPSK